MKALILVGGEGTRLRPLTINTLKGLVPIANKPFFKYQFEVLKKHGIKEVILSICHLPERIKKEIGDGKKYGMKVNYVRETTPLGTGGAVKNCEKFFDESMIVMNGDIIMDVNLTDLIAMHKKKKALASITLHEVDDPSAYGLVNTDKHNRIQSFVEKPTNYTGDTGWINAGIYVFDRKILDYIPPGKNFSLERGVFPEILKQNETVMAYKSAEYWLDIGKVEKYMQANFDAIDKRFESVLVHKARGKFNVYAGNGNKIHKKAVLRGPAMVGHRCAIGPSNINPLTIIGNDVVIGGNCNLEMCILWDGVIIGDNVTIKNAVIGRDCVIHNGSVIHNSALGDGTKVTKHTKIGGEM